MRFVELSNTVALVLELVSVGFALVYLALAIPQSLWCWPAALISTAIWMLVSLNAKLYMDSALQIFYFAMRLSRPSVDLKDCCRPTAPAFSKTS